MTNLTDLFHSLEAPATAGKIFTANPIPGAMHSRIGKDGDGQPALLFVLSPALRRMNLMSYRLKYLELTHNVTCTIKESGSEVSDTFTLVRFTSQVPQLQDYFLQYAESLIQTVESNPTQQQLSESIAMVVEIFSLLTESPIKSIQGLWAELFVISASRDPASMVDFWHAKPEEKFDFSSGTESLEIKSSANYERTHYFSLEQLNPAPGTRALIASLLVRHSSNGWSLQRLIGNIESKLEGNADLISKLNLLVAKTLGSSLEEHLNAQLDVDTARETLQFYHADDVPRIIEAHVPSQVTEVRFKSTLRAAPTVDIAAMPNKGRLFAAL